jgi:hypothetical protein
MPTSGHHSPELGPQYPKSSSGAGIHPVKKEPICVIKSYAGYSLGGRQGNLAKVNQDSLVMYEDTRTLSVILGVFDGHGAHGREISQVT